MKKVLILLGCLALTACGCYETTADAWEACDAKYNGKCRYLGKDYKVCGE